MTRGSPSSKPSSASGTSSGPPPQDDEEPRRRGKDRRGCLTVGLIVGVSVLAVLVLMALAMLGGLPGRASVEVASTRQSPIR